jgi:peptidoglycan hydrolase-like protein with peptidoglycan-binding domain
VDGVVGRKTWGALRKAAGGARPPGPDAYPGTPLRRGSTGPHVRKVQGWLNKVRNIRNEPKLAVDGHFGPATEGRVRQFQGNHKLAVDGFVGRKTWGALRKAAT